VQLNVQGRLGFSRIGLEDVILLILAESRMELLRLMIIVYLLRNHLGVRYEYPPWYSSDVWEALRSLIRAGLVNRYSDSRGFVMVSATGSGLSKISKLVSSFNDAMVMVGPALIMSMSDLRARISEVTRTYVNTPLNILASIALSDAAHERYYLGDKSPIFRVLWEASRILSSGCEGTLG
jgi:hypothetical protein